MPCYGSVRWKEGQSISPTHCGYGRCMDLRFVPPGFAPGKNYCTACIELIEKDVKLLK